jgi:1-acyl-sn-glycerol-3-phosphate acyltransferase
MTSGVARALYGACYYLSWFWFAAVALALNAACVPLLLIPGSPRAGALVRRAIRSLFSLWGWWLDWSGVVRVAWLGFERPLTAGTVYVANHPTLVDATVILSRLPDAICVMKPSLMRNPFTGPAAAAAGYVVFGRTVDGVRDAAAKVAAGKSLLIFPEGTRTPDGAILGPMVHGFLMSAERARAPVELLVVRASPGLGRKGSPWWRLPPVLPASITVTQDRRWEWDGRRTSAELLVELEGRMKAALD